MACCFLAELAVRTLAQVACAISCGNSADPVKKGDVLGFGAHIGSALD